MELYCTPVLSVSRVHKYDQNQKGLRQAGAKVETACIHDFIDCSSGMLSVLQKHCQVTAELRV